MRDSQVPINMEVFETPVSHAAWRSKPSWAIISNDDQAFGQGTLLYMANRMGASVTEEPGSQAAFISQAEAVAEVIVQAVQEIALGSLRNSD
ncbi:hypothetical protein [Roseibium sp. M-1]